MEVFNNYLIITTTNIEKIKSSLLFSQLLDNTSEETITDNNIFGCAAVCLLLCAEFENYFENIATEIVNIAKQKWENPTSRELTSPLISLLADKLYAGENTAIKEILQLHFIAQTNSLEQPHFIEKLSATITKLRENYDKTITNNHGIKLDNLKKIYLPIGFPIDNLRDTYVRFFDTLDTLGQKRGDFAHKSPHVISLLNKQEIERYIRDCKKICRLVRNKAISLCGQQGLPL